MVDVNFEKLKINFSSLPILFKGQEGLLFVISKRENRHYVRERGWGVSERDWSIRGIDWGRERERERKSLGHSKREIGALKREKDIEVFEKEIGAFKRGTIEREGGRERERERGGEREIFLPCDWIYCYSSWTGHISCYQCCTFTTIYLSHFYLIQTTFNPVYVLCYPVYCNTFCSGQTRGHDCLNIDQR